MSVVLKDTGTRKALPLGDDGKKILGNLFACVQLRVSAEISISMRMHDATWPFYRNRYRKTLPPVPVSFRLLPVNLPLVTVKVRKIASCNGLPLFFLPKPVSGGKPQYGKNSETGMPVVTA